MVGDEGDLAELQAQILAFARKHGVSRLRALGREGFVKHAKTLGWRPGPRLFVKEI